MTTLHTTHGVVQDGLLIYSVQNNGVSRQLIRVEKPMFTVVDLFNLAIEHKLDTIWVCAGDTLNHWTSAYAQDLTGWDAKITYTRNRVRGMPDVIRNITARRLTGTFLERRFITIAYPVHSTLSWDVEHTPQAIDPLAALASIHYTEQALGGIPLKANPGISGRNLIAELNSTASRPQWIRQPAYDMTRFKDINAGYDFAYSRVIERTDAEGQYRKIYGWDKNSMYLAACSSVELGSGEPTHLKPDTFDHYETMTHWYDGKRPGYWRIDLYDTVPGPFNPLYPGQEWVTTPLLKCLFALGARFAVREAYVWTEHHRILDTFATRVWTARQDLKINIGKGNKYPHASGAALAYHNIKRVATVTIGLLANESAAQYSPQWYRKDWRDTIVEEAKVRLLYKLLKIYRVYRALPLAVATDCSFYAVDDLDPVLVFGGEFDGADRLGGHKLAYDLDVTDASMACFKPGMSAARCVREVKDLMSELKAGQVL